MEPLDPPSTAQKELANGRECKIVAKIAVDSIFIVEQTKYLFDKLLFINSNIKLLFINSNIKQYVKILVCSLH